MEEKIEEKPPAVNNQPVGEAKPKKKKHCCLWIVIIILILIGVGAYLSLDRLKNIFDFKTATEKANQGSSEEIDWNGEYSGPLAVKEAKIDKEKSVTKTFGQEGGTMSTQAADGTLYTLTVSPDSLILPAEVSMSPLMESPVVGFDKPAAGYGVYLSGGFKFIRPSYLTIQPNTKMPELGPNKAVTWGRCNIASRGYDPEICAGIKKIDFGGGIEPGKVVVHAINGKENKYILLASTIPVQANAYNAQIFQSGAYFGDKIDKKMANELAMKTFLGGYEHANATEVLMHLLTLKGDLAPFKEKIDRLARGDGSYPRESVKAAIILLASDNKEGYDMRIEDFKKTIDKNFKNLRGSFIHWGRFIALLEQMGINDKSAFLSTNKALADDGLGDWPTDLPDYDENAKGDTGGSSWGKAFLDALNQLYRNILATKHYSCTERLMAAEALEQLGTIDAQDRAAMNSILSKCADQCKTLQECEQEGDAANKRGDQDAITAVNYRITAFLEQGSDCTSQTKKNLENYGQNFCN